MSEYGQKDDDTSTIIHVITPTLYKWIDGKT